MSLYQLTNTLDSSTLFGYAHLYWTTFIFNAVTSSLLVLVSEHTTHGRQRKRTCGVSRQHTRGTAHKVESLQNDWATLSVKLRRCYSFTLLNILFLPLGKAERRALEAKHEFDHVSKLVKSEVARFERERIEDFKASLHLFLQGMTSRQKQVRIDMNVSLR